MFKLAAVECVAQLYARGIMKWVDSLAQAIKVSAGCFDRIMDQYMSTQTG